MSLTYSKLEQQQQQQHRTQTRTHWGPRTASPRLGCCIRRRQLQANLHEVHEARWKPMGRLQSAADFLRCRDDCNTNRHIDRVVGDILATFAPRAHTDRHFSGILSAYYLWLAASAMGQHAAALILVPSAAARVC